MQMSQEDLKDEHKYSAFECNICMGIASNPVVTTCGHLYCWSCIYHWLGSNQQYLSCPVCKNGIETSKLIPLFTKHSNEQNEVREQGVPPRPKPKRNQQVPNPAAIGAGLPNSIANIGANLHRGVLLAGYGLFPSVAMQALQQNNDINDDGLPQPSPELRYQTLFQTIRFILLLLCFCFVVFS